MNLFSGTKVRNMVISLMVMIFLLVALPGFSAGKQEAGGDMEIVFIPKLIGVPWFNAMEDGLKDYAKEAGGIKITVAGAPDTDPAAQARILEDTIARKPAAIIVVPNDTKVLEPLMKKAQEAGILMIAQEAASAQNVDADIEFLTPDKVGEDYMKTFARDAGEKGGYAIMVGGLTVESHNARADYAVKYQEKNYPELYQVVSRLEGSESVDEAHDKTLELIKAYPDLVGVLYIGTLGPIGGATAVEEKNLIGKVAIVGTAIPSQAKPYLKRGSLTGAVISNPYRIGVDSAYITKTLLENGANVSALKSVPEYGAVEIDGKVITFYAPSQVTVENADSFGF